MQWKGTALVSIHSVGRSGHSLRISPAPSNSVLSARFLIISPLSFEIWGRRAGNRCVPCWTPIRKDYCAWMASCADTMTSVYEIRLVGIASSNAVLLAITAASVEDATDFARRALKRHPECTEAEVWHAMRLIRQV